MGTAPPTEGSGLHQFDADAVGSSDVAQQVAAYPSFQFHRELHAFRPQLLTKRSQITMIHKAEMVDPARVMAGEVGELADGFGGDGVFARSLAADKYCHVAEIDKNLRRASSDRVGGDRGAEHLNVPIR